MIHSKIPNIGTSIFAVMSKMASEYNAVNLSQGFPDFQISEELIDLVGKYMKNGNNQYAPMPGVQVLREKISAKINKLYSRYYNPETEITITAGGTQALNSAITAIVNEGDEVIIFEPAYDSYSPVVKLNGGQSVYVTLEAPEYNVDWQEVNKLINSRTRLIIINTPHNPTGNIFSDEDMIMLQKMILGTKIMILSDEVYEHIIFDGFEHNSIAKYPQLVDRSVIVGSFGKTYHATGWKTGYCVAPEKIMNEIRKIHQFTVFAANTPIQHAIAEYMDNENEYLKLGKFYQRKRDLFNGYLTEIGYKINPSKGTYFQAVDFSEMTDLSDNLLAEKLIKEFGIASIPMSAFSHGQTSENILRFCFAKSDETLELAAEKLDDFYKSVK